MQGGLHHELNFWINTELVWRPCPKGTSFKLGYLIWKGMSSPSCKSNTKLLKLTMNRWSDLSPNAIPVNGKHIGMQFRTTLRFLITKVFLHLGVCLRSSPCFVGPNIGLKSKIITIKGYVTNLLLQKGFLKPLEVHQDVDT